MIKFLRIIRQKALTENRFGKYFIYAVGEIVLVVLGILIALQINNWKEEKRQEVSEKEFFDGLTNDLNRDSQVIQVTISDIDRRINSFDILNNQSIVLSKEIIDSLIKDYFVPTTTFYPVSGTFESAISGNKIGGFKNKKTINAVVKLYNSDYQRLIDNANALDDRFEFLAKKYSHYRRINSWNNINQENLNEILDDFHFHYKVLQWYNENLKNNHKEINQLLFEIKQETSTVFKHKR